jgi:hypothetical protein
MIVRKFIIESGVSDTNNRGGNNRDDSNRNRDANHYSGTGNDCRRSTSNAPPPQLKRARFRAEML